MVKYFTMKKFTISAIQQVGVGTADFRRSWDWYIEHFGFDVKILEDDTVAERMLPYTGGRSRKRHACIAVNLQGGGGLEIWQYSNRVPKPAAFKVGVGDTGIFGAKIKCADVQKFHARLSAKGVKTSALSAAPDGAPCFWVLDLFGNAFQIVERKDVFIRDGKLCGGVAGALVGVTQMDRSIEFYRDVLGYDRLEYDRTGRFDDWSFPAGPTASASDVPQTPDFPGGGERYRRVLLSRSEAPGGAFGGLLGSNAIELVQPLDREPRRIFEDRFWGDPGFIQICYDVSGMDELGRFCASKGHPFTVDSCPNGEVFDMGEASGRFTYIEDPDGTLIEFVETLKVPVAARLGWYIDLKRRDPRKPLPKFLFKAMGLISRQKI